MTFHDLQLFITYHFYHCNVDCSFSAISSEKILACSILIKVSIKGTILARQWLSNASWNSFYLTTLLEFSRHAQNTIIDIATL